MPSTVSFREDGSILAGTAAKAAMLVYPENTVSSAKRDMGRRGFSYSVAGKAPSPADIGALVLKKLRDAACEYLHEDVQDAVITVPAYFNDEQRADTKRAGEAAGLNVLRLLTEPTAAALAYGVNQRKDQTLLVYDLGGGTFDVSILQVKGNNFTDIAVGGDSRLGGDDFDEVLVRWVFQQLEARSGKQLSSTLQSSREGRQAHQRLKEACEAAKIELSESSSASISIPDVAGTAVDLTITLDEYNRLIEPLLEKTIQIMRGVLRDARLTADDIDRVILVGGSTKNRAVKALVTREIKEPFVAPRVDEVVAHGAAVYASSMFTPEEDTLPIEVTNVLGRSLGIAMLSPRGREYVPIIPRQTVYPCRMGVLGQTRDAYQEGVLIEVYRGENSDFSDCEELGDLSMPVDPPQFEKVPVGAIFDYDADGLLHVTAVQFATDHSAECILEHAWQHDGQLDVDGALDLVRTAKARARSVDIDTNARRRM